MFNTMSFRKKIAIIAVTTILMAVMRSAQAGMSGADLLSLCVEVEESQSDMVKAAQCMRYVDGIADGWDAAIELLDRKSTDVGFCIPSGVTRGELARAVLSFIRTHSEDMDAHSSLLVLASLIATYPCK